MELQDVCFPEINKLLNTGLIKPHPERVRGIRHLRHDNPLGCIHLVLHSLERLQQLQLSMIIFAKLIRLALPKTGSFDPIYNATPMFGHHVHQVAVAHVLWVHEVNGCKHNPRQWFRQAPQSIQCFHHTLHMKLEALREL